MNDGAIVKANGRNNTKNEKQPRVKKAVKWCNERESFIHK